MQELNSLEDVLDLCSSVGKDTAEETITQVTQTLIELGMFQREPLVKAFEALHEKLGHQLNRLVFQPIVDLELTDVETGTVFTALKGATGASITALRKDFSSYLRANDLIAEQESTATVLVKLALEKGLEMWHDPEGNPWATLEAGDHVEHHRLKTKAVRRYLAHLYYQEKEAAPNSQAVQDALMTLEARAIFEGPEHAVFTRLAEIDNVIYLDLGNEAWEAVQISTDGWEVQEAAKLPVRFRRPGGMLPLQIPERGGTLEPLANLLNVKPNSRDHRLIVAWLLQALRGAGPYPVLVLTGEQGSGKSSAAKMLRAILDPNVSPLRSLSRDERDLFIAAVNGWAPAFDNISGLSQWTSDALCKLSTGGGLSTRELYSDDQETLLDALRPVVLNGITDFVDKQDLVSRALQIHLPSIPKTKRKPEAAMWQDFEAARPKLLGALLTVVVQGLKRLPTTSLETLPRLADFALWATACEAPLGWAPGDFMQAYDAAQAELIKDALEAEPIAGPLLTLLTHGDLPISKWEGTATELLKTLTEIAGYADKRPPKGWPGASHVLSGTLKRIAPALLEQGLIVEQLNRSDANGSKNWLIRKVEENKRQKRQSEKSKQENNVQNGTKASDPSSDASQSSDASSVRSHEQASGEKHRAGQQNKASDASDASKTVFSDIGEKEKGWEDL